MKKRKLGLFNVVMLGLSGAIGFEIFVLLDYAYFHLAGPSIIVSLVLAGIINLLIMLSYCELGAAIPKVGGEYTYIKTAYGAYVSFISGSFRWLASIFVAALAAVAFVLQIGYLFSFVSPEVQSLILSQIPLVSVLVVLVFGVLEVRGVRKLGDIIVISLIVAFIGLIVGGLVQELGPVDPINKPLLQDLSGILTAAVYVFPMFFGMRSIVASAPNAKHPEKDIPKGLIISALLVIPLYVSLAYIAVSTVPLEASQLSVPLLSQTAETLFGNFGGIVFAVAGMAASLSALGTSLTVQSSIIRGMSRDGYLPKILLSVNSRFGTYHVAIITGSLFIMLLSATGTVPFLGYAASFGSLCVFALINLSLLKLRKDKPHMERPFKTPLYPLTPLVGIVLSIALLFFPMFLGDVNAGDALMSGIGLITFVVGTYYLRMLGRARVQIAIGGIGIGLGVAGLLLTLLVEIGLVAPFFPFIPAYVALFFSIVAIIAGILNFNAGAKTK